MFSGGGEQHGHGRREHDKYGDTVVVGGCAVSARALLAHPPTRACVRKPRHPQGAATWHAHRANLVTVSLEASNGEPLPCFPTQKVGPAMFWVITWNPNRFGHDRAPKVRPSARNVEQRDVDHAMRHTVTAQARHTVTAQTHHTGTVTTNQRDVDHAMRHCGSGVGGSQQRQAGQHDV